ncbi:hypothetical protein G4V62_12555 [Bacillaceae bacterium SIJ1]|uniref:hypothetical protein n=1 Tax=Litoribacterium kuwaitense TaxID=1398745 RepID=UPI0013EB3D7F|nr:hypothetical protein [Litoribacterium kuwaitense]NGP45745.1 hypothetical protein [Litoribacterium kuwaitense]
MTFTFFSATTVAAIAMIAVCLAIRCAKRLNHSQRMVISMFCGTCLGLVVGLLFGMLFSGQLFLSTMLGILTGSLLGLICGMFLGLVSCFEGLIAGLMGGMMGAMLGEMLTPAKVTLTIKILLPLSMCSLLLYGVFIHRPSQDSTVKQKRWLLKPFLSLLFIMTYLMFGEAFIARFL